MGSEASTNPYLNSPPPLPRYIYPRSDDEEDEEDEEEEGVNESSAYCTLERSRSMTRWNMRRLKAFGGQLPGERKGSQLVSSWYFNSFGRNAEEGSGRKERSERSRPRLVLSSFSYSLAFKVSGPRAAATRPLLLHSHKPSLSPSRSHKVSFRSNPREPANILVSRQKPLTSRHPPRSRAYLSRGISLQTRSDWCARSHVVTLPLLCFPPPQYVLYRFLRFFIGSSLARCKPNPGFLHRPQLPSHVSHI